MLAVGEQDGARRGVGDGGRAQRVPDHLRQRVELARVVGGRDLEVRDQRAPGGGRVGEAAGRAHVVLEHPEAPVGVAHEVEPGDADPQPAGRLDALHAGLEVLRALDHPLRHDALGDDPALPVDVGHERVERAHALGQAGLDPRPLGGRDHARHGIDHEHLVADRGVEDDALVGAVALDRHRQLLEVAPRERAHGAARRGPDRAVGVDDLVVPARLLRVVVEQGARLLGERHCGGASPIPADLEIPTGV